MGGRALRPALAPATQPLRARFLVAGRPVDLTREDRARQLLHLQPVVKAVGWMKSYSTAYPGRISSRLQARATPARLQLNVRRQTHREPVDVDLVDVQSFGFQEKLVRFLVRETHHLVFE